MTDDMTDAVARIRRFAPANARKERQRAVQDLIRACDGNAEEAGRVLRAVLAPEERVSAERLRQLGSGS